MNLLKVRARTEKGFAGYTGHLYRVYGFRIHKKEDEFMEVISNVANGFIGLFQAVEKPLWGG